MKRYGLLLGLVLAMSTAAPAAISITPSEPTSSDVVFVTVSWWTPSTGYRLKFLALQIMGNEILLDAYWHSPLAAGQALRRHECTRHVGVLRPGTYTVYLRHHGLDFETRGESMTFTVRPSDSSPGANDGPARDDGIWSWWSYFWGSCPPVSGRVSLLH